MYEAITAKRVYHSEQSPYTAFDILKMANKNKVNQLVVSVLYEICKENGELE